MRFGTVVAGVLVAALWLGLLPFSSTVALGGEPVSIGSKTFTESYILAEIAAQLLEHEGIAVERRPGLGGTLIAWEALREGSVDLYPEYTGTLTQTVLRSPDIDATELRQTLAGLGLAVVAELGFENGYAIVADRALARERGLASIADLGGHPDLRLGFSHEFLNRADGWQALRRAYDLPHLARGIEHALAYRAIAGGQLHVTDAYTTDGELAVYELEFLRDTLGFFPEYDAVLLAREDLPESARSVLQRLEGRIDEARMRQMNRRAADLGEAPRQVAAAFLREEGLVGKPAAVRRSVAGRILGHTLVHLKLTSAALAMACVVAIPLALLLAPVPPVARGFLYATGLLQTIPALALLALLIPLTGLGALPAVLALFLYSLLPIARNTLTGLFGVDPLLRQVATGMGLSRWQRLRYVELPLAAPTILAGIKTAAIISIGTATLAAFVGAGGLGQPIITGLTLNDHRLILQGAIPAALLAVVVELLFEALERWLVPAHLRS